MLINDYIKIGVTKYIYYQGRSHAELRFPPCNVCAARLEGCVRSKAPRNFIMHPFYVPELHECGSWVFVPSQVSVRLRASILPLNNNTFELTLM